MKSSKLTSMLYYSMGRVRAAIHKLGYSYKKGYIIYSKMPKDAELSLKKKLRDFNPKTHDIYLLDQVACQNLSNSPKTICKTSKKNILIQNPDKYSRTGIGLQGINSESHISFPPNHRKKEMIKLFMEVKQRNSNNSYLVNQYIPNILNYENLKITEIIAELEQELSEDPLLKQETSEDSLLKQETSENSLLKQETSEDSLLKTMILNHVYPDKSKKQIIKDLKKHAEKEKMSKKHETANKKKLEEILERLYVASLMLLESFFSADKPSVVVLDNYPVHHAKLLKEACVYMNIILVHLPPYSPKLNPIEQVWRTIKKELSAEFIESEEFLVSNFERLFYENADKKSFTRNWVDEFIFDRSNDLLIADMCECAVLAE